MGVKVGRAVWDVAPDWRFEPVSSIDTDFAAGASGHFLHPCRGATITRIDTANLRGCFHMETPTQPVESPPGCCRNLGVWTTWRPR